MKLVKASYQILSDISKETILKSIELAGRTCYKSEDRITQDSAFKFVEMLISRGHESVLEHEKITIKFICDRGVSHEIVRHRICSYSQESTRYVNYNNKGMEFIVPCWFNSDKQDDIHNEKGGSIWLNSIYGAMQDYNDLMCIGWKPEQARSILPNSLKTEIVVTANLRQWREIFRQRTSVKAHPQMREIMRPLLDELKEKLNPIFNDISYE